MCLPWNPTTGIPIRAPTATTAVPIIPRSDASTAVGTRARIVREGPGGDQTITYEITEVDRPRSSAFKGIDGSIRPMGRYVLTPLDGGARTKYDFEFDFETHGLTGKMFGKVARRGAEKELPEDLARLKAKLES